jgi:hypothetical protein
MSADIMKERRDEYRQKERDVPMSALPAAWHGKKAVVDMATRAMKHRARVQFMIPAMRSFV